LGYAMYHKTKWREDIETTFQVKLPTEVDFVRWLNGRPVDGHATNLSAMFLHYYSRVKDGAF
jgi:hypothetical protein